MCAPPESAARKAPGKPRVEAPESNITSGIYTFDDRTSVRGGSIPAHRGQKRAAKAPKETKSADSEETVSSVQSSRPKKKGIRARSDGKIPFRKADKVVTSPAPPDAGVPADRMETVPCATESSPKKKGFFAKVGGKMSFKKASPPYDSSPKQQEHPPLPLSGQPLRDPSSTYAVEAGPTSSHINGQRGGSVDPRTEESTVDPTTGESTLHAPTTNATKVPQEDVSSDLGMSPPPGPSWLPLQAQEGLPAAARSGLQSPHVPSCTPSSPSEDQEAQSTPSVVDTCSPSLVDLDAGSSSSMVDLSSPPLVDLESKSSSLVVDQDDAILKNVGGAPVLGQNQAGQGCSIHLMGLTT
ncbi:hypothetical protein WJX82_000926 [Trebouxia sp. C0006]